MYLTRCVQYSEYPLLPYLPSYFPSFSFLPSCLLSLYLSVKFKKWGTKKNSLPRCAPFTGWDGHIFEAKKGSLIFFFFFPMITCYIFTRGQNHRIPSIYCIPDAPHLTCLTFSSFYVDIDIFRLIVQ